MKLHYQKNLNVLNEHNDQNFTPLMYASENGKYEIVKFLLDNKANPDQGAIQKI